MQTESSNAASREDEGHPPAFPGPSSGSDTSSSSGSSPVAPGTPPPGTPPTGSPPPGSGEIDHAKLRRTLLTLGRGSQRVDLSRALARILRETAEAVGASCAALCLLSPERTHADLILEFGPPPPVSHLGSMPPFLEVGEPWPGVAATEGPPPAVLAAISEGGDVMIDGEGPGGDAALPSSWGTAVTKLGCPLPGQEQAYGAVFLAREQGAPFSDEAALILTAVAAQIALRVEQARLEQQGEAHAVREAALAEVAEALIGTDDLEVALSDTAKILRRVLECDGVRIWRLDATARTLDLELSLGIPGDRPDTQIASDIPDTPEVEALESGTVVTMPQINAPKLDVTDVLRSAGMRSGACCVMGTPQRRDGTVCVYFRDRGDLPEESAQFLRSVANLLAGGLERRKAHNDLRQAQKLDAIGRLAGGIAHDFNNLLTVISGYVDIAQNRLGEGSPAASALSEVTLAAERATELTAKLLTFSRHQKQDRRPIDIEALVQGMTGFMQRLIGQGLTYRIDVEDTLPVVRADRGSLEQVLLNLFVNARDASAEGGRITVRAVAVAPGTAPPAVGGLPLSNPHVALMVTDEGTGMTPDVMERIFEPFFTTKEVGSGTGLGLASAYATVRQAGGEIRVASKPGEGSTFAILLPAVVGVTAPRAAPPKLAARGGTETILIVEDRRAIRELAQVTLETQGYGVLVASDGVEALEVAARQDRPIDLLVTDVIMPRMGGVELAQTLSGLQPELRVLFVSGYPGTDLSGRHAGAPVLKKPFAADELGYKVREALDGAP